MLLRGRGQDVVRPGPIVKETRGPTGSAEPVVRFSTPAPSLEVTQGISPEQEAIMKRPWLVVLFLAGLALPSAACLTSLHPWFTAEDLVFEPGLVGTWVDASDADTTWVFTRRDDTTYTLVDTRNESEPDPFNKTAPKPKHFVTTRLTARLMRLGEARYLDICAGDEWTDSSMLGYLLVNSHALAKVRLEGDALRVAFLDDDRLEAMLGDKRFVLAHEIVDVDGGADDPPTRVHSDGRRVLLTAPTSELRQFLAKYTTDGAAFEAEQVMRRMSPAR